jgi:hypothetical protein
MKWTRPRPNDSEKIGWNWFWFAPLSLALLFFVESHTIPFGITILKLALKRWRWGGLISPSAYICFSAVLASVFYPVQGILLSMASLSNGSKTTRNRFIQTLLLMAIVAIVPIVTDTLIWGSFPFTFDNAGWVRLRMIPFLPWPSGGYMGF